MLGKKALFNRLEKHFQEYYRDYYQTADWHPDCSDSIWKFDIRELRKTITLTCDKATGKVTEREEELNVPPFDVYTNFEKVDWYVLNTDTLDE